jgi:DNA-binding FadR family transcriptional regulator
LPKIVASHIEQSLRQRIAAGEWSASKRLPPERDLAAEYGVARNTIRRALGAVANSGILDRHVGRGTFVSCATGEIDTILRHVTEASPADLIAARLIIEPKAAAIAAKKGRTSDLRAVADAHFRASEALLTDEFEHWDSLFHRRLLAATRNELLISIHAIIQGTDSLHSLIELKRKSFSEDHLRDYCAHHANMVAALADRDADAAEEEMFKSIKTIEAALFVYRHATSRQT